ncbi:MAG: type I-U CRISPR-associated protein Csb2, partial [Acidimicrobiales bacterium]
MTVALEVRYPWGRVHATPWGRHTNEGAVEWPPAPRRILRALYATWATRHPGLDSEAVHRLLDRLTKVPSYGTDEVRRGSTRHYLAADRHTAASYDRDLAIDAFISCRPDRGVIVQWECELEADEQEVLAQLVPSVPFLGRADSICEMQLTDARIKDRPIQWAPLEATDSGDGELTDLLAATSPLDVEALVETPAKVRSSKRLQPRGSVSVTYQAHRVEHETGVTRRRPRRTVEAVRLLLDGRAEVHRHQAVALAHLLRQAALKQRRVPSPTLAGKDDDGNRLDQQHSHAHYLVFAAGPGTVEAAAGLDTALVWAPGGLSDEDVRALTRIDRLVSSHLKEVPAQRLVVEGVGAIEDIAPELCAPSRVWRSVTPFAITHYPKDRRPLEQHVAEQVVEELTRRDLPYGEVSIEDRDWRRFRRHRPDGRSM